MKLFSKVLFVVIMTLAAQQSFAWGKTGHRIVAEIAQRHLTKKAKQGISELFGVEPMAFWANWPDLILSDTTHQYDGSDKWHYVDLPGNIGRDEFVQDLKNLKGETLYTQIPVLIAQLKDKSLPIEKRQTALKFLVHFIGDLHQPLHVGRDDGSQGGNKIQLNFFKKPTNLHTLWDSGLIDNNLYSYTEYATVLDVKNKDEQKAIQQSSLEDWFYESHVEADKIYEQSPANADLSYKYVFIFQDDINNQLLKGGLRLAEVLNETFK
jgi:hypothetical protein